MNAPQGSQETEAVEFDRGPGARLRDAREAVGLSLEEVAARLRLDDHTVRALENDAFDDLPAPTFVRGYVRGYSRLLNLSPDTLMEAYDRRGFEPPALVADISDRPQARSSDIAVRFVTYLIVAGLVVLVVLWWRSQQFYPVSFLGAGQPAEETGAALDDPQTPPATLTPADDGALDVAGGDATMTVPPSEAPGPAEQPAPGADPESVAASAAPDVADTLPGATPAPPPEVTAPEADIAPPAVSAATVPATPVVAESPPTEPDSQRAAAALPPPRSENLSPAVTDLPEPPSTPRPPASPLTPTPSAAAVGGRRLIMNFTDESWVEVYDRNEGRLFFNLVSAGGQIDVSGAEPLRVLLGRARGVTVTFNGAAFDYSAFVSRGIARFTLGAGAAPAPQPAATPPQAATPPESGAGLTPEP